LRCKRTGHNGRLRRRIGCMPDDGQGLNRKPCDRDIDWEFTASFTKYINAHYTPRARLLRFWHSLTGSEHHGPLPLPDRPPRPIGGVLRHQRTQVQRQQQPQPLQPQKQSPHHQVASRIDTGSVGNPVRGSGAAKAEAWAAKEAIAAAAHGPPVLERLMCAAAYLLPLAGTLRSARPLTTSFPELRHVCEPLMMLAGPLSSTLAVGAATSILCYVVLDRTTVRWSYFMRYNCYQALLLGGLVSLLGLPCALASSGHAADASFRGALTILPGGILGGGSRKVGLAVIELLCGAWGLGIGVTAWAWSSGCCILGRFPDRIPVVSGLADRHMR